LNISSTADSRERALALYRGLERGLSRKRLGRPIPSDLVHASLSLPAGGRPSVAALVAGLGGLPPGWAARPVWLGVGPSVRLGDAVLLLDALLRLGAERVRLEALESAPAAPVLNGTELPPSGEAVFDALPPARIAEGPVGFTTPCEWPWGLPPVVVPAGR
jgi:hypothetical protein